jgi:uncharacterized membrane protein YhaH (DUF805 family)
MIKSRQLAAVIGPSLVALAVTEVINFHIFEDQIAPVVYLNGTILFVVGLALIRSHNRWTWGWPILITATGWVLLIGGFYRMLRPEAPQLQAGFIAYAVLTTVAMIGLFLCLKSSVRSRRFGR